MILFTVFSGTPSAFRREFLYSLRHVASIRSWTAFPICEATLSLTSSEPSPGNCLPKMIDLIGLSSDVAEKYRGSGL